MRPSTCLSRLRFLCNSAGTAVVRSRAPAARPPFRARKRASPSSGVKRLLGTITGRADSRSRDASLRGDAAALTSLPELRTSGDLAVPARASARVPERQRATPGGVAPRSRNPRKPGTPPLLARCTSYNESRPRTWCTPAVHNGLSLSSWGRQRSPVWSHGRASASSQSPRGAVPTAKLVRYALELTRERGRHKASCLPRKPWGRVAIRLASRQSRPAPRGSP
jgi:hypothetical protein